MILLIPVLLVSCTTYKVKKDDHSYTYIYQHNENPETIQMNNKIKKPSSDNLEIPTKGAIKNYYQQPMSAVIEQEPPLLGEPDISQKAPSTYSPEMNDMMTRNYRQQQDRVNSRNLAHGYSSYPYYTPSRPF